MTVGELIARLQVFDPDLQVAAYHPYVSGHGYLNTLDAFDVQMDVVTESGKAYHDDEGRLKFHNDTFVDVVRIGYND